jgi:hypothetical protein
VLLFYNLLKKVLDFRDQKLVRAILKLEKEHGEKLSDYVLEKFS